MMKKLLYFLILTYSSLTLAQVSGLASEEIKNLEKGQLVTKTKKIPEEVWPQITIYSLIDADPLEAVAIFYALDHQKKYVPNVIKSDPVKYVSPTEIHTAYEMDLPWPASNSKYISGAKLSRPNAGEYRVDFYQVQSDSADEAKGFAHFIPFKNKTLYIYQSFVRPKSFLAGLLRKFMIKDTEKSVAALRLEIKKLKTQKSPLMNEYKTKIVDAFKGKKVYQLVKLDK